MSSRIYNGVTGNRYMFSVAGYRVGFPMAIFYGGLTIGALFTAMLLQSSSIALIAIGILYIVGMSLGVALTLLLDMADPDWVLPESVVISLVLRALRARTWTNTKEEVQ